MILGLIFIITFLLGLVRTLTSKEEKDVSGLRDGIILIGIAILALMVIMLV